MLLAPFELLKGKVSLIARGSSLDQRPHKTRGYGKNGKRGQSNYGAIAAHKLCGAVDKSIGTRANRFVPQVAPQIISHRGDGRIALPGILFQCLRDDSVEIPAQQPAQFIRSGGTPSGIRSRFFAAAPHRYDFGWTSRLLVHNRSDQ